MYFYRIIRNEKQGFWRYFSREILCGVVDTSVFISNETYVLLH
jgi:hypothetical protein